jgi:predicted ATPase
MTFPRSIQLSSFLSFPPDSAVLSLEPLIKAILALPLSPKPPPLICIEEPELGLHPDAVALLADVLVDASSRAQIIVTTHSDALVSGLTDCADSVLVCEHRGGTEFKRLESRKLKHWLDRYRLGDLVHDHPAVRLSDNRH